MAKIKIIDDDVEFAENMSTILQEDGHDVSVLETTDEAVESLMEDKPDLLVLDVMFPGNPVAGFTLAREIRRTRELKDLPIIMLTGVNQEFPMDFTAKDIDPHWMPVQDFVEKLVSPSVLVEKIRKMLAANG